jgi:hypothetical protein
MLLHDRASNFRFCSFASKVLVFSIGPKKASFNIHEALLQLKTSFFDVHPEPNGGNNLAQGKEAELETAFKSESSPSTDTDMSDPTVGVHTPSMSSATVDSANATTSPDSNEPTVITADYHLDTHFVKAFAIFVEWLYNTPPKDPKTPTQCKTLIQTYLLALKYRAQGLQNLLLDCIRRFHIENQVNFDMLFVYLLNRHGDDVECKLIKYFVDQIAYEIADTGVEEFDSANGGFEYFLRERPQGKVRTALMHALGKIAAAGKSGKKIMDPALAQVHEYYVF